MVRLVRLFISIVLLLGVVPKLAFAEGTSNFDSDLNTYLSEISAIRGFTVTKEDIENSLSNYDETLADFTTVYGPDGLKEFMGDVIKSDYSNLTYMKDEYGLTIDQVASLLQKNGEELNDYVFVDDLDQAVNFYLYPDGGGPGDPTSLDLVKQMLPILQSEFGLTDQELANLENHLKGINLSTPEYLDQLNNLAQKMETFGEFQSIDQLSPSQIQELLSIYNDFLSLLEVKVDFELVNGVKDTPVSLIDVLKMTDLTNAKLKVNIYDLNGNFLADLIVTGDMVDSKTVNQVGKDINTSTDKAMKVTPISNTATQKMAVKTIKGGELPDTAGNYLLNVLIGIMMLLGGTVLYRSFVRRAA